MKRALVVCALALFACAPRVDQRDCGSPFVESMVWGSVEGEVVEVRAPASFTMRKADGRVVEVTVLNVGQPFHSDAQATLRRLLGDRAKVLVNLSATDDARIAGEVHASNRNVNRELLRAGMAAWHPAPPYAVSSYSECVNRNTSEEAKRERRGIWQ